MSDNRIQDHIQMDDAATHPSDADANSASEVPGLESRTTAPLIAEAKRYRKRAQAAEKMIEDLKSDLAVREKTIAEHAKAIEQLQQRQAIDDALLEARTIDPETARLLIAFDLAKMAQPDVAAAVTELRRRKPFLFAHGTPARPQSTRAAGRGT